MSREANKKLKKLVCATIVALALGCGVGETRAACVDSNSIVQDGIEYYMQTDKSVYSLGENVKMLYRVTNLSDSNAVTFEFSNIQQWSFEVRDGTTTIWRWPKQILPALSSFTLKAGDVRGYFKEWDMTNDNTGTIVTPGTYDVIGALYDVRDLERYVPVAVQIEIMEGPYCGDANHPYPAGDLNHDCKVNLLDLAILASHWLERVNLEPVVYITEPEDGAVIDSKIDSVWITATARDVDGSVVKVEFFIDGIKFYEDNDGSDGWKASTNFYPGTYILTARATDDEGATTTSPPVTITAVK